ncbi:ABC transporter substrate-binding protein [Paenibacillus wenxiniae]|uniref:ABC transporter substrate-binding protein n=1 Tax=Paenibacillus wenxiniae TaxID=1636843 RepID=A0ABW4RMG3_9BACL
MRLAEEYVCLRINWSEHSEAEAFHVTTAELAAALCCTPRNARLITARLVDAGWITFVSGRGRGHTSVLTFCQSLTQVVLDEAKERVQRGDVADAFGWIRESGIAEQVEVIFRSWLGEYFGYTVGRPSPTELTDILRLPIYRPVVCLDPADAVFAFDTQLIDQLYSRLVEFSAEEQKLLPGIAHAWACAADGKMWTFYLYKHVRFHHDRLLTADDVVASLRRLQSGDYTHSWLLAKVAKIHATSPYTVVITLTEPNYWLPLLLSHSGASIVPDGLWQEHLLPIGTGAYRLIERTAGRCVLERFEAYYGTGALLDRIEIVIVPEQEAPLARAGSQGMLTVLTGEFDTAAFHHLPRQDVQTGVSMLMLNRRHGILAEDEALRQALCDGVDRAALVAAMGDTYIAPARGLLLSHTSSTRADNLCVDSNGSRSNITSIAPVNVANDGTDNDDGMRHLAISEARQYINEDQQYNAVKQLQFSAYDGRELQLYTFQRHERVAYWLREAYNNIGIRIAVHIVAWSDLVSDEIVDQADLLLFEAVIGGGVQRQLEYMHSSQSLIRRMLPQELLTLLEPLTARLLLTNMPVYDGSSSQLHVSQDSKPASVSHLSLEQKSTSSEPASIGNVFVQCGDSVSALSQQQQQQQQHHPDQSLQEQQRLAATPLSAAEWLHRINHLLQATSSAVFLAERSASMILPSFVRGVHMNERGWVDFGRLYMVEQNQV